MANPKSVYYTFRKVKDGPLTVEAKKWDDMVSEDVPIETYIVRPEGAGLSRCSCPAYRECKHYKCVVEAMADNKINELWAWKWTEHQGWIKLDDITPIQDWAV